MKKFLAIIATLSLVMISSAAYSVNSGPQASNPPPISQALVAEGDFAFQLVTTLKLGTPATEGQAEDILTSVGIAPKNGWIADYPMTPIVVGQVQDALIAAAESKKLPMGKEEALKAFRTAIVEAGIPIVVELPGKYAETQPEYVESSAVDDYYSNEGPPVVTYYPPPPDYGYLYAWVPYPFFSAGFFFPGFFVLNDFDIVVLRDHSGHHFHHDHDFDHHGHDFDHRITNHFRDPKANDFRRVDPTTRTAGMVVNTSATRMADLRSPDARRGATSIFNRSVQTSRSAGLKRIPGRNTGGATPRTVSSRAFSQPGNVGRTLSGPGRSFSTPMSRSFTPSQGFARSFSPPSRPFSAAPLGGRASFGGIHGGSFGGFLGGVGGFHR